jgi:hypothetical protein
MRKSAVGPILNYMLKPVSLPILLPLISVPFPHPLLRIGGRYSDWLQAGLQRRRSSSPCRIKNFLFSTLSRPALGSTELPTQWVLRALSLGVKRPERETDHSPATSAEVKKEWFYTSTSLYVFMA